MVGDLFFIYFLLTQNRIHIKQNVFFVLTGAIQMDVTRTFLPHSGLKVENPELENNPNNNSHLAVTEGLIKEEQDIDISSHGSIVGCNEMADRPCVTLTVADG
jgi:hypothetical protein